MRRLTFLSLSLAAAMTQFPLVHAAHANWVTDVRDFHGTITDVGVVRGPRQIGGVEYRVRGEFTSPVDIDLPKSTFTINEFFADISGELMRASQGTGGPDTDPLLKPCGFNTPGKCTLPAEKFDLDEAKYVSPGRFRPQIRVTVEKNVEEDGDIVFEFDVRLDRGMMRVRPDPAQCVLGSDGRTRMPIRTSFTIAEQNTLPLRSVTVEFTKAWECTQPERYHMRSR